MFDKDMEAELKARLKRAISNAGLRLSDPESGPVLQRELDVIKRCMVDCIKLEHAKRGPNEIVLKAGFDKNRFMSYLRGDVQ